MSSGVNRDFVPFSPMSVDKLERTYQEMDGPNSHLTSSIGKTIYAKANDPNKQELHNGFPSHVEKGKENFWARNAIADSKRDVRRCLNKYVGKKATNRIFEQSGVRRYNTNLLNINNRAIGKRELGTMLGAAHKEKLAQSLRGMSDDQKTALLQRMQPMDSRRIMSDPQTATLFELFNKTTYAAENAGMFAEVGRLGDLLAEHDQIAAANPADARLPGKLDEMRAQLLNLKELASSGDHNLSYASARKLRNLQENTIQNMTAADFRNLQDGKFRGSGNNTAGLLAKMHGTLNKYLNGQKQLLMTEVRATQGLDVGRVEGGDEMRALKTLRDRMTGDDHLRGGAGVLYKKAGHGVQGGGKFNHAKTHFWNVFFKTNRAEKFTGAKLDVQRLVAKATGDAGAAAKILKPFLAKNRALSKADLSTIISAAESHVAAKAKVDQLIAGGQTHAPDAIRLLNEPDSPWADAMADFGDMRRTSAFDNARDLSRLTAKISESALPKDFDWFSEQGKRDADDACIAAMKEAKTLARQVLKQSGLPKALRNDLANFVKLPDVPYDAGDLATRVHQLRVDTTGEGSAYAELHAEFTKFVADAQAPPMRQQVVFGGVVSVPVGDSEQEFSETRDSTSYDSDDVSVTDSRGPNAQQPNDPIAPPRDNNSVQSDADIIDQQFDADARAEIGLTGPTPQGDLADLVANPERPGVGQQLDLESLDGFLDNQVKAFDAARSEIASNVSSVSSEAPELNDRVRETLIPRFQAVGVSVASPVFDTCVEQITTLLYQQGLDADADMAKAFGQEDVQSRMMEAFANDRAIKNDDPKGVRDGLELLDDRLAENVRNGVLGDQYSEAVHTLDNMIDVANQSLDAGHKGTAGKILRDANELLTSLISQAIVNAKD